MAHRFRSTLSLGTNLDSKDYPSCAFADLYQCWRIEEAFKRIMPRLKLGSAHCGEGLSQQDLIIDVAAKNVADRLAALRGCIGSGRFAAS